jgi:hypothetical protein
LKEIYKHIGMIQSLRSNALAYNPSRFKRGQVDALKNQATIGMADLHKAA